VPTTHPSVGDFQLVGNDPEHRAASGTAGGETHAQIIAGDPHAKQCWRH
jgi:hypothetical protein